MLRVKDIFPYIRNCRMRIQRNECTVCIVVRSIDNNLFCYKQDWKYYADSRIIEIYGDEYGIILEVE